MKVAIGRWILKRWFGIEPKQAFYYQCQCGTEYLKLLPEPGAIISFTCKPCQTQHSMIWLKDYWQVSSVFKIVSKFPDLES